MAPFVYQPGWQNSLAPSIAELIQRRGDLAGTAAINIGNAQARAAELSGQGWSQAVNNIAQTAAAIPQQIQQQKVAAQESTLRDQAIKEGQQKLSDRDAIDAAFKTPGGMDAIIKQLPGHLQGTVQKQFSEAQELAGKIAKQRDELRQSETDYMGHLGATIRDHNYDPTAAQLALSHAKTVYADDPKVLDQIGQLEQVFQGDPERIKPIVDAVISSSSSQQKLDVSKQEADARTAQAATAARRVEVETPLIQANTQLAQTKIEDVPNERALKQAQLTELTQKLAGTTPLSSKDRAELQLQHDRLSAEIKHWGNEDAANNTAVSLTPDALELTAKNYAMTGQLPPMGMGKQGAAVRSQIINSAAGMYKGLDLASQRSAYEANKASLKNATETLDKVAGFEKVAGKNLDNFLALADKVPDTGVPWVNQPIRALDKTIVGSTNQAAFEAARDVALREIARVTSDPKLSGALTDSARAEVQSLSPQNATFAQIKAVAKVLKQDMANVHDGLSAQISDIQQRIATPPGGSAPPAASPSTPPNTPAGPALTPGLQRLGNR